MASSGVRQLQLVQSPRSAKLHQQRHKKDNSGSLETGRAHSKRLDTVELITDKEDGGGGTERLK